MQSRHGMVEMRLPVAEVRTQRDCCDHDVRAGRAGKAGQAGREASPILPVLPIVPFLPPTLSDPAGWQDLALGGLEVRTTAAQQVGAPGERLLEEALLLEHLAENHAKHFGV